MPEKKVWRTIQPAHRGGRITVAQAKKIWLEIEREAEERKARAKNRKRSSSKEKPREQGPLPERADAEDLR